MGYFFFGDEDEVFCDFRMTDFVGVIVGDEHMIKFLGIKSKIK